MFPYALQGSNGKVDAEKAKVLVHEPRF